MAVINPPAWLQQGTYPARTDRLVMASLIESSGVVSSTDLVVTQSTTPAMTVTVTAGSAWILGTNVSYQGAYNFVNDSQVVLSVPVANASLGRRDIVVARVQDASVSGSVNSATLEVISGTPASSPVIPTTPANSIRLAVLTVNANATSITTSNINRSDVPIARIHQRMTPSTEIVTSTTRPGASDRFVGMQIFETDTQRRWMWSGSVWAYQGGGMPPRAYMYTSSTVSRAVATADIYWLGKVTDSWDNAYFTYGNGINGGAGDYIQITQSGNYSINYFMHTDRGGAPYYAQIYPKFSPTLPGTVPVAAIGSNTPTGWMRMHNEIRRYIPAGTKIYLTLYNNQVVNVKETGMFVQMVP